ncbi:MAG TPA: cytochrome c oxidase assembly protein, partial [Vicinamibacterales bacterium]|nr:cytochrome c oxidase assembly protein [Vicinamibacterales bacterium]
PVTVSALYAGAIWLAHVPRVYQAALTDPAVHLLLVALLLAVGYLFWTTLIRGSAAGGILMAFAALVQTGLLGALLTFAPTPWYPVFASRAAPWGLTPLEDQQLAGLIMWVPMGAVYLAAGLAALARLLARLDVAVPR